MINSELVEARGIIDLIASMLLGSLKPLKGHLAADARRDVGIMVRNAVMLIVTGTFPEAIVTCANSIRLAGATLAGITALRVAMSAEAPSYLAGRSIVKATLLICLAQEARIIASTTFESRQDVNSVAAAVALAYAPVEEIFSEWTDPSIFLALLRLHSDIVRYLTDAARPLPKMISYDFPITMPSLAMSNRIYGVGDRAEQLVLENKVVHPAFMPRAGQMLAN